MDVKTDTKDLPQYSTAEAPMDEKQPQQPNLAPGNEQSYAMQPPPQAPMPVMQQQPGAILPPIVGQQQYATAVNLQFLKGESAPVDCPICRQRGMTSREYVAGSMNLIVAGAVCLSCCCLAIIPYMMDGLKDVQHKCANCGGLLATWHRNGRTEVHAYA